MENLLNYTSDGIGAKFPKNVKQQEPKILYKSPPNILKQKSNDLLEPPLEIKPIITSISRPSAKETLEADETPDENKKELKILIKDQKQVHWETSQKSFGKTYSLDPKSTIAYKQRPIQKFTEIPHLLDGFKMLNHACTDDPNDVYSLNMSRCDLEYIIEDDLPIFKNLQTLDVSENALPFAKLGCLSNLKKLNFSCNGLKSLDLELEGRFLKLESLDLSYNNVDQAALIVLATLPNLKYLDLTSNNMKYIAPEIQDMDHWKDHVIALIFPFEVAALGLNFNEQSKQGNPSTTEPTNPFLFKTTPDIPSIIHEKIGFSNLETLILEKNRLGEIDPASMWSILSKLPRLKTLNLSKCLLSATSTMVPLKYANHSIEEILSIKIEKFQGFPMLSCLNITHNTIDSIENLIGIIFLPSLKNVYLEGNPVMKNCVPKHLQSKRRQAAKIDHFDIFSYFQEHYDITISDDCYIAPFQVGKVVSMKRSKKAHISTKKQSSFIKKSIKVTAASMQNPKLIEDMIFSNATIKERIARRHYQFHEKDIEDIIKTGKIPSVKKLMNLIEQKEEEDHKSCGAINEVEKYVQASENNTASTMNYDRNQNDKTFITGVHIVDTGGLESDENPDTDLPTIYDVALPLNILGSVKALRIALKNPGAMKRSLIPPVVASKRTNSTSKTKEHLPSPLTSNKNYFIQDSISRGQSKPCDDFEEMEEIMESVQRKLQEIESGVLSMLDSKARFAKRTQLSD